MRQPKWTFNTVQDSGRFGQNIHISLEERQTTLSSSVGRTWSGASSVQSLPGTGRPDELQYISRAIPIHVSGYHHQASSSSATVVTTVAWQGDSSIIHVMSPVPGSSWLSPHHPTTDDGGSVALLPLLRVRPNGVSCRQLAIRPREGRGMVCRACTVAPPPHTNARPVRPIVEAIRRELNE